MEVKLLDFTGTIDGRWRDKELIRSFQVIDAEARDYDGTVLSVVDCRLYMGRSSQANDVYCLLWMRGSGDTKFGHGRASGYNYDKASHAVGCAIENAGIELSERIHGTGEIRPALLAIASAMGAKRPVIIEAYA